MITSQLARFSFTGWLPVQWRIQFKLCVLMNSVHYGRAPRYIVDILQLVSVTSNRHGLRSAQSTNYATPRLRTRFAERAFPYAAPDAWNSLSPQLRDKPKIRLFKAHLKTHFLNQVFS